MIETIHSIQKEILIRLMRSKRELSFGKLLPSKMKFESDRFNYHLQMLIKEEYIEKNDYGYKLTIKGLKFISKLTATGDEYSPLKVSIALMVVRTVNGQKEVLLQNRLRHPFFGDVNSIAGKVRPGELITDAAKRKLFEEAGLLGDATLIGVLRKCRLDKEGCILEDTLYHYCVVENPTGELIESNEYGTNFWVSVERVPELMSKNFDEGPEDKKVFDRLMSGDYSSFYIEQKRVVEGYTKDW